MYSNRWKSKHDRHESSFFEQILHTRRSPYPTLNLVETNYQRKGGETKKKKWNEIHDEDKQIVFVVVARR